MIFGKEGYATFKINKTNHLATPIDITGTPADETHFRRVVESLIDHAVIATDPSGRITSWNTGARRILGYEEGEILGRNIDLIFSPEDRAAGRAAAEMERALAEGRAEDERWHVRKDGSRFWASGMLMPLRGEAGGTAGFVKILRDRTEQHEAEKAGAERLAVETAGRERAEEALLQAQKMEAVGRMAGTLAHDFNNILLAAVGNLERLQQRIGDQPRLAEPARAALDAMQRGERMVQQLLAFSRRQFLVPRRVDVNTLITGMDDLLRRVLPARIALRRRLAADLKPALVDLDLLERALMNLALNARDAIAERGRITIETANVALPRRGVPLAEGLAPGPYVRLVIRDTGAGMTPDVAVRVFEPFFTTKPAGIGTGLGLSMVYGFVRQSKGWIAIDSKPGRGTTVSLYLPPAADS